MVRRARHERSPAPILFGFPLALHLSKVVLGALRDRRGTGAGLCGWLAAAIVCLVAAAPPAAALPLLVEYVDRDGEGFDDPDLGEARRFAFEHAVGLWAELLAGDVPVVIEVAMRPFGGSGASALLAQAGALSVHRNFAGAAPDVWYGAALANQLAGEDVNGESFAEIGITFNGDVDDSVVLGSVDWYYGTDARPGFDVDLVTIALHELGHGLNFFDLIRSSTGEPLLQGSFGIFEHQLFRPTVGPFPALLAAERLAAITSGSLFWDGPNVLEAFRQPARIYAPAVFESGSSISHWDTSLDPDELIEPFYTEPNHDPGLLLPALMDMGWQLAVPTPTPRSTAAIEPTPTSTRPATPTRRPTGTPAPISHVAYVANFDSDTLSVIAGGAGAVIDTIPIRGGPLGVVATRDGERIYVTSFHGGVLNEVSGRTREVLRRMRIAESAHSVALSPEADRAYVTDTYTGRLAVVDLVKGELHSAIEIGLQPVGVAAAPDGRRVYVANFGSDTISVVDAELESVVAIVNVRPDRELPRRGPLDVAVAPNGRFYCRTLSLQESVACADTRELRGTIFSSSAFGYAPERIAIAPDGRTAYATLQVSPLAGRLLIFDPRAPGAVPGPGPVHIPVGPQPVGVAVSPDSLLVYVTNSAAGTVSVVDAALRMGVAVIEVGTTPMGVAVGVLPPEPPTPTATATPAPCAGDCRGDGSVDVGDLVLAVRIALGQDALAACSRADANGDGVLTVDELVVAASNALGACVP